MCFVNNVVIALIHTQIQSLLYKQYKHHYVLNYPKAEALILLFRPNVSLLCFLYLNKASSREWTFT